MFYCNSLSKVYSGVYSNFNGFIADEYKHGWIFTLCLQIFSIVSNFSAFHEEVNYLKDVLRKNYFSYYFS